MDRKKIDFVFYTLFILFLILSKTELRANVINISNNGCKYSVDIPTGWDTIPKAVLKEKFKQYNVDLGIYPFVQKEYFSENYALFAFIPTLKSLNLLTFNQIISEQKNLMKQGAIINDTLDVQFIQTDTEVIDGAYSIYSYYKIQHRSDLLNMCQAFRLTKFGYIMILTYQKEIAEAMPVEKVSALLSKFISVQSDYIYSEPQGKEFRLKNILISLAIGVFVYVLIMGISKLQKKK